MARSLFIIVLLTLCHTTAYAQTDTIRVSGQVKCGTEPIEYGVVTMLQPTDSTIVAYSMTNGEGRYSLHAVSPLSEMLVRVTGFNVKRQVVRIEAHSQTLDFNVEEENIILREVTIKSQKLWGNRDTLNYLVSAYTRDRDRTIGDVLRQLPGITIEDNGVIKYQGTPINHFYLENLDMLQGRYNLATQGIKAEDVATVQVMENHEHVRALNDQEPGESAAINLRLKDKAKGVWTKSADLGAGGYGDEPLWSATLQTMYFSKKHQHMLRYGGDNMGRGYDAATVHYGISASGASSMLGIIKHGSSPVGNSLFGYRHGVNLNNVSRLPDSATINYNLNYSHNLSRGNSFSQTTYILPDASELVLTEDIADRTHTNSANLQLTYEKNKARRFINNTLSFSGKWNEGRGNVNATSQALHHRSLSLTNRTDFVHRTAKGGGFNWTSTNSLSSSPQALAIGGDMTARQDIDVTSVSTYNTFSTLRNLKKHKWTLSASAHLNTTYTTLTSRLNHPDAPVASNGDMGHLHASVGFGPVVRYVNGSFMSTLNLPVAMTYTNLNNESIPGEETDADRVRLLLQPSFTLLWKATDHFTFNADAGYSTNETSWRNLLTANVMNNYRNLSRYRAALNDSYGANARFKVSYKDMFNSVFAHLEGSWNRSWSDIAYGTTLDEQAHTVIEAAHMPNHSNNYSLTAYGRKDIDWQTMQLELSATATRGDNEILRQSELTKYRSTGYTLRGSLGFDIVSGYRVEYGATWQRHQSKSNNSDIVSSSLNQHGRLDLRLMPSRLSLNVNLRHTHNSNLSSDKKDYLFIGAGLKYKMSKSVEFNLDADNLTNINTYTTRSLGDMEEFYCVYHLRPMSITLTAHITL